MPYEMDKYNHIKLSDGMVIELKDVRYVPQLKKKCDFD